MLTLNQSLHQTSHQSILMRKVRLLGFKDIDDLIQLAVIRGCYHFKNTLPATKLHDPGPNMLSHDELIVLLLHGNNRDEPMAIRCAAQLLKSKFVSPHNVAFLAIQERCETPLRYIAQQGLKHDIEGHSLWKTILHTLKGRGAIAPAGILPHPSRFIINPGIQRGGLQQPFWLTPLETNNE